MMSNVRTVCLSPELGADDQRGQEADVPVHLNMARLAQRPHIARIVAVRMAFWQIVVGMLRGLLIARLADRPFVEKQPVPFLTAVRLGGAGLSPPCAWVTHFIFLSATIGSPIASCFMSDAPGGAALGTSLRSQKFR